MAEQPQFDPTPINRAMAIKGYKLVSLAKKVGCSVNAVWSITNAKSNRPKYLKEVCKVLGVKVEDCYPLPTAARLPETVQ